MSGDSERVDDPVAGPSGLQSVDSEGDEAVFSVQSFYRRSSARVGGVTRGDRPSTAGVRQFSGGARPRTTVSNILEQGVSDESSNSELESHESDVYRPVDAPTQRRGARGGDSDGDSGPGDDRGEGGDGNDNVSVQPDNAAGGDGVGNGNGSDGDHDSERGDGDGESRVERGRGRKRARRPEQWKRQVAKTKRNLGQAYQSVYSDKDVAAKRIGNPCRDGCFDKLGEEAVNDIFKGFWALGNFEDQSNYLVGRVKSKAIKRKRTTREVSQRRTNYEYSVHYRGNDTVVCRDGFLAMHAISKRKVEYVVKVKKTATGTTTPDQRGRRAPPNVITGERLDHVHDHIQMLPVTSSHYTRAKSPNRKYLGSEGSIPQLYSKYKEWLSQTYPDEDAVSERKYRHIFSGEYNIGFEPPKKDTCATCGRLETAIHRRQEENLEVVALQEELNVHQTKFKRARAELKAMKNDQDPFRLCIAIDLQQTLPCPRLTVGPAYYKRKLWVYNFAITNLKSKKTTLYVWDETSGGKGSTEVASCINKWLDVTLGRQCVGGRHTLTIFADNCAGQNKNLQMVLMGLREVHSRRLARLELSFLVSGHSYMPCDAVFGNIELEIRRRNIIQSPQEYREAIKHAVTPPYEVVHMVRQEFMDVNHLLTLVTKRKVPGGKFASATQIVVSEHYKEGYILKNAFDVQDQAAIKVRVMPGRRGYSQEHFDLSAVDLPMKYAHDRQLLRDKLTDIRYLTEEYITQAHNRQWWQNLLARQEALYSQGVPVSTDSEDDIDDPDNINMDYDVVPAPNRA